MGRKIVIFGIAEEKPVSLDDTALNAELDSRVLMRQLINTGLYS